MLFRQNMPKLKSKIRFLHAIPSAPAIDVYLSDSLFGKNLAFSDISCYENISPGNYEMQLYKAGTYDKPLITKEIEILPNTSSTVNLVTLSGKLDILKLNDATGKGELTNCFLRFMNLSPNAPLLTLSLPNDIPLFNDVEYLETTGYYALSPAIYDFKVSFSSLAGLYKFINEKTLTNGKFYTIYIIGLLNKQPKLGYLIVDDGIK
jgi:hypothetical protein